MFGKKFSEYVQFERWILILITLVFVVRLVTNARWAGIVLPHFSNSDTFAMPAFAQASSCSWLEPELPTPPIMSFPT